MMPFWVKKKKKMGILLFCLFEKRREEERFSDDEVIKARWAEMEYIAEFWAFLGNSEEVSGSRFQLPLLDHKVKTKKDLITALCICGEHKGGHSFYLRVMRWIPLSSV